MENPNSNQYSDPLLGKYQNVHKECIGPVIIVQSKIVRVQSHENAMIACWLLSWLGGAVACLLAYLDVSKLWPPNFLSDLSPVSFG